MQWDTEFAISILPRLMEGVIVTIQATLLGAVVAFTLGLLLAVGRLVSGPVPSKCLYWGGEFIRRTPLLVQLYFLFYLLPEIGIVLSPLVAGVIGIGLHYSTYTAEVYRAGIENVDRGQWEAARALNYPPAQTWTKVIIPQAVPPMIPALANYLITMFKETPLLSAITVIELMNSARIVANQTYRYIEPITMVGLFFLAVSIPSVLLSLWLENRFARQD
ncbi:MAG: ectoine/hydroxyectoine ABC transporter permease subunit EhuD [Roseovarius sp.]|nr:ectoine/hydroxyectoine ABC transporter permease subunit EhuD [Roseovarius sp.]MCY4316970.1 ectoine/hydroxyectoine ABC transporter permease subunit EhuD [Roseovarius sp.]